MLLLAFMPSLQLLLCIGFLLFLAFLLLLAFLAGGPDSAGVLAVDVVSAVANFNGLFCHVDDRITVEYLIPHCHLYCNTVPLVCHHHSVISLSPILPITQHSVIAQLWCRPLADKTNPVLRLVVPR